MNIVHPCAERGCETLTMGELCLEHERAADGRLHHRLRRGARRGRAPALTLAVAMAAIAAGRLSGRFS